MNMRHLTDFSEIESDPRQLRGLLFLCPLSNYIRHSMGQIVFDYHVHLF